MKAWRLWPAGLSPAAGIGGHVLWVADTPRMSGGRVSTGPRLAPRTLRRPLRPLSLLVLRPDVSSCPLPVFLYLFVISHELVQEGSTARVAFLPFSASSSVPSVLGCVVSGWRRPFSLACCRLWPPQGRKPHLSALSSQCLETALASWAELDTRFSKPRVEER